MVVFVINNVICLFSFCLWKDNSGENGPSKQDRPIAGQ